MASPHAVVWMMTDSKDLGYSAISDDGLQKIEMYKELFVDSNDFLVCGGGNQDIADDEAKSYSSSTAFQGIFLICRW